MDKVYVIIALILMAIGWPLFKFIRLRIHGTSPIEDGLLWECPKCKDRNYAENIKCGNCGAKRPREFRVFDAQGKEQNTQKLWQQFEGMQNTNDVLIEKAKAIAPFVVAMAGNDTNVLFTELKKDNYRNIEGKFTEVFFETVIFYLHFIDRNAFQHLGAERRSIFIDALFIEVREQLSRVNEGGIESEVFRSFFSEAYNERQYEYGQYEKIVADDEEAFDGTLLWEFGKKIAGVLDTEMDILVIMSAQTIAYSLSALQLPELFENNST